MTKIELAREIAKRTTARFIEIAVGGHAVGSARVRRWRQHGAQAVENTPGFR